MVITEADMGKGLPIYLDISLAVYEDVLWFEVSVDNVQVVQVLKGHYYL